MDEKGADEVRWNHNIHYHPLVLSAVPDRARDVVDVGCGEAMLARRLATRHERVVGIDRDEASIASAAAAVGVGARPRMGDQCDRGSSGPAAARSTSWPDPLGASVAHGLAPAADVRRDA